MTISQTSFLSEILNGETIPVGKLAYFRARLSNRLHELVLLEFDRLSKAGRINRAELAKRIGREPAQVTRWLGAPGNWTFDTFSDLALGMGCEPSVSLTALAGAGQSSRQDAGNKTIALKLQLTMTATNEIRWTGTNG
jgi:hypothetical protein